LLPESASLQPAIVQNSRLCGSGRLLPGMHQGIMRLEDSGKVTSRLMDKQAWLWIING
jgi:hypothetical protein